MYCKYFLNFLLQWVYSQNKIRFETLLLFLQNAQATHEMPRGQSQAILVLPTKFRHYVYILPIAFHHFMKCLTFLGISWNALLHRLPVTHTHIYIYIHTHTLHVLYSWDSTHHFSVHTAVWCSNHCAPIQGQKGLNNVLYHVFLFPKWLQCHMSPKKKKKKKKNTKQRQRKLFAEFTENRLNT